MKRTILRILAGLTGLVAVAILVFIVTRRPLADLRPPVITIEPSPTGR